MLFAVLCTVFLVVWSFVSVMMEEMMGDGRRGEGERAVSAVQVYVGLEHAADQGWGSWLQRTTAAAAPVVVAFLDRCYAPET